VIKHTQVVTLAKVVLKFRLLVLLVLLVRIVHNAIDFLPLLTTHILGTAFPLVVVHTSSLKYPGQT